MTSVDSLPHRPSGREVYEATYYGAQTRPYVPPLRSDPPTYHPLPHSLVEFRRLEGRERREHNLRQLWLKLPKRNGDPLEDTDELSAQHPVSNERTLSQESAKKLKRMYEDELVGRCGARTLRRNIGWREFQKYAENKERELWHIFHDQLDLDGNGHLDAEELAIALKQAELAGISLSPTTLSEFMNALTSSPHPRAINFQEFRDFLLLLPRTASPAEIFRYYTVKKSMGDDGRGAARVNMEGDVSLSAEDMATKHPRSIPQFTSEVSISQDEYSPEDGEDEDEFFDHEEEEEEHHEFLGGSVAARFLLAGGFAGAVSRTCTAPFDRLKIFLITRPPDLGGTSLSPTAPARGFKAIAAAITRIYHEGGVLAFWTGNGLSVAKILPESAIKFLTYESSKRMFAKYVDKVEDIREINGVSRFLSGGMGGITSQLSIYPIETLKTQMMSSAGNRRNLLEAAKRVYSMGGARGFYRGLTIGLVGVFPYSAIDMSTFEALKLAYLRSTGKDEPGVLALLAFGSVSGSVGATSVYPLNLVRTRLQASGSSGHPQRYTGIFDVVQQTYTRDGWRGFYRGLLPTLAKVVPAVSISYVVYESSKRRLGV
ncbi:mitochondrial carrier family protein [Abortiporus biennis]